MSLAVGLIMVAARVERDESQRFQWRALFIASGFVPISIAIAEWRSGYAWKNLTPGNRGVARADGPRQFWVSVIVHTALGCGLIAFGFLATPPQTDTPKTGDAKTRRSLLVPSFSPTAMGEV